MPLYTPDFDNIMENGVFAQNNYTKLFKIGIFEFRFHPFHLSIKSDGLQQPLQSVQDRVSLSNPTIWLIFKFSSKENGNKIELGGNINLRFINDMPMLSFGLGNRFKG